MYFATMNSLRGMRLWLTSRVNLSDRGAAAVEYGLLVGLIAAVIVVAVALLGTDLNNLFGNTTNSICGTGTACTAP
ncbi:MAG: Flp family type IVb pilin [Acidimicrobiales bacterium]